MTAAATRSSRALSVAGAVVSASGFATTAALLDAPGRTVLLPLSEVGLALGVGILLIGRTGIVGSSRPACAVFLLFGLGPLIYRFEPAPASWSVLIGTLTIGVITSATVASAVLVVRTGRVHGVARWGLLLLAADALLTAVLSTVPAEGLALVYPGGHLELVRPLTLVVWGIALVLQSAAIRHGAAVAIAGWKRTTDVGGSSRVDPATPALESRDRLVGTD